MKIKYIFLILIAGLFYTCDVIDEPFEELSQFDCDYDAGKPIRKILIEDFTGWDCPNCLQAARDIEDIVEKYPCHVVAIGIHAGYFANIAGGPDFTTQIGYDLGGDGSSATNTGFFEIADQPMGVINRINWGSDYKLDRNVWSQTVHDLLTQDYRSNLSIEIENQFNEATREVTTNIVCTTFGEIQSKLNLVVYVIESNIVGKQKDGGTLIKDYIHNHVLRGGFNGTWGEEISSSPSVAANTEFANVYTMTLDEEWVPVNCQVVAFVTNSETKEVYQVEEQEVIHE